MTARTQLLLVPGVALPDGVAVEMPSADGMAIPAAVSAGYTSLEIVLALPDSDKLVVGKSLVIAAEKSDDGGATWQFIGGTTWRSYGPSGLAVTDPDGAVWTNRDPTLGIAFNDDVSAGALFRTQLQGSGGFSTADFTIYGLVP